jgi:5-formyltetrahydrofolate cyclo-ligase
MDAKAKLRQEVRRVLKRISPADRAAASEKARALLLSQPSWHCAKTILYYAPLGDEPDLWPLLQDSLLEGRTVLLPRFNPQTNDYRACVIVNPETDLVPGAFGVREPSERCPEFSLNRLDFALVPGVAFDRAGSRLGRGRGYYDRLLAGFEGLKCGVAFDQQIVGGIPVEPHDIRLNCILTPSGWITVNGPGRQ